MTDEGFVRLPLFVKERVRAPEVEGVIVNVAEGDERAGNVTGLLVIVSPVTLSTTVTATAEASVPFAVSVKLPEAVLTGPETAYAVAGLVLSPV